MVKEAECRLRSNDILKAEAVCQRVIDKYPNTTAAKDASGLMAQILLSKSYATREIPFDVKHEISDLIAIANESPSGTEHSKNAILLREEVEAKELHQKGLDYLKLRNSKARNAAIHYFRMCNEKYSHTEAGKMSAEKLIQLNVPLTLNDE